MLHAPADLVHRLRLHGQDHLLNTWGQLGQKQRVALVEQLAGIDLAELDELYKSATTGGGAIRKLGNISPLRTEDYASLSPEARAIGEEALRQGKVATLLVAGGQGSRLGFDKPKGMYEIGPVSGASLFQIHAEKVLAISRRYGRAMPFLIMTSAATHEDTVGFFEDNHYFGLEVEQVSFFQQGTMPALDLATGKLLLSGPGQLFQSPNGHGGVLIALSDSGLLADLRESGIEHLFYFQVDNPLVYVADPGFIGRHIQTSSEASSKVINKRDASEKVGVLAEIDGRCGIIEYSDMPDEMAHEIDSTGQLKYRTGSPAIHLFTIDFLEKVTSGANRLKYHTARKKVPFYDPTIQEVVEPETENAFKFELFIFDALPQADRWLAITVDREEEFAPVKSAMGADSPEEAQRALCRRAARWLKKANACVECSETGDPIYTVEISPLFALDADELRTRLPANFQVDEAIVLCVS